MMKLNNCIMRIFDARAKAGKREILRQKLAQTSVLVVEGKPGNLGYFFGENLSSQQNDLVFISVWQDLASIQSVFGEHWQEAYLPEGYAEIIESCAIKHIAFNGHLGSPSPDGADQSIL